MSVKIAMPKNVITNATKNNIAKNVLRRWTFEAVLCYNRGCKCEGCINMSLETPCLMKRTVVALVREFGAPKELPGGCKHKLNCDNETCKNRNICGIDKE